jgi:glycerol-3-phosphate O-acyltransferase
MSILSTIRAWTTQIGVYHAGSLYKEDNFPLYWLVRKVLSKVQITDETAEELKALSEKGVVVYALKNKSPLNSLILREICVRKGIPQPVYCHGINMITWQPSPMAFRVIMSHISRRIFRRSPPVQTPEDHLGELVQGRKSVIIHLGDSELFENPSVERTLLRLMEVQKTLEVPIYLCPELITYGRRREKEEEENLINISSARATHRSDPASHHLPPLFEQGLCHLRRAGPVGRLCEVRRRAVPGGTGPTTAG